MPPWKGWNSQSALAGFPAGHVSVSCSNYASTSGSLRWLLLCWVIDMSHRFADTPTGTLCVYSLCFSQWWETQNSQLIESNAFSLSLPYEVFCQIGFSTRKEETNVQLNLCSVKKRWDWQRTTESLAMLSWIRWDPKTQTGNRLDNKVKFKLLACNKRQDDTAKKNKW